MTNVAVIGDGQMALVMADALTARGVHVRLWGPFPTHVDDLAERRKSARLPHFMLSDDVRVTPNAEEALSEVDIALNAIPTQYIRKVWGDISNYVPTGVPVACVAKGIEIGTNVLPTQIIEELLGEGHSTCVLSGPTIATELVRRQPAVMVSSSIDEAVAKQVQDLFDVPWLRVYTHGDPLGVELAGALKNVIAIAAGICDGMELGDNAKSAMLARGLAEISRLGVSLGAQLETFFGIAGVGDLATTCFSPHGRNRTCGERLGKGEELQTITETMGSVVEGVSTTKAVHSLAQEQGVEMPIASVMYRVLFEGLSIHDAISSLMSRDLRAEQLRR
ncbi:MAG: NAD(P)-dependent glycerol-3-phosphate dehydrogenase [Phycisphaerales bacterium]|nr:NAD(P)-dependent glycerol-3-phosphate dehydrogenase [Planctomycetota bacterium]MBL6997533.1 NAD(P)-dependent glycerol-3-phosphate dehydrogenase [Phycisphaerales bacterium]